MDLDTARKTIIAFSFAALTLIFVFFVFAPIAGYPLEYADSWRFYTMFAPLFIGYLVNGVAYLFTDTPVPNVRPGAESLLPYLVWGTIVVFTVASISALVAFGLSHRAAAPPGEGMSLDTLALWLSGALAILTAILGLIVSNIFAVPQNSN